MKNELRGKHFHNDEALKKAVQDLLEEKDKTFFAKGMMKLVERWTKCFENDGDYVKINRLLVLYSLRIKKYKACIFTF